MIATDGVFSMDGNIARLDDICDLADKLRRAGPRSTTATPPASSARPAAAPTSTAAHRPRRHHHLDPRQGPRRGRRRLHGGKRRDRRIAAQPLAPVPVLELLAPPIVAAALAVMDLLTETTELRDRSTPTPRGSATA
jgi:glycine C-acetyltransferase